jgi:hypothetical protein
MATFKRVSYTTDAGTVGRIRMSASSQGVAGQGSLITAITDPNLYAFASNPGSKRKKQLNARGIRLVRTLGTGDATKTLRTFVPITTKAALDALVVGTAVTINAVAYTIGDKIQEA